MRELVEHWWVVMLRGMLAIVFAASIWFSPLIIGTTWRMLLQPFVFAVFGIYIVLDSLLLLLLLGRLPRHVTIRSLFALQATSSLLIGIVLLSVTRESVYWLILLSIAQSLFTGVYELFVAAHLHKHLSQEWTVFIVGVGSLIFCGGLIALYSGELSRAFDWIIAYAAFFGTTLLWLSWRLRAFHTRCANKKSVFASS